MLWIIQYYITTIIIKRIRYQIKSYLALDSLNRKILDIDPIFWHYAATLWLIFSSLLDFFFDLRASDFLNCSLALSVQLSPPLPRKRWKMAANLDLENVCKK